MSSLIDIDPQEYAGAALIGEAVDEMQAAFVFEKKINGLTQAKLAQKLGLKHRSTVNRWLLGKDNLSLKTLGELAWALGRRATIKFVNDDGEQSPANDKSDGDEAALKTNATSVYMGIGSPRYDAYSANTVTAKPLKADASHD